MVVGLCVTDSSCTDPETTDSTKFAIFYAGITDIALYEFQHVRTDLHRRYTLRFFYHSHYS
ncbi:DUF4958 family protein [Bacteroides thetaiotaomicron]|nr:DUF4958 family protein [Bacteroides thetaiotaomicron]